MGEKPSVPPTLILPSRLILKKEVPCARAPSAPLLTIESLSCLPQNYNLVDFRGVPQNPTFRVDELETLVTTFDARAGDIFICTYPKCGTTWMQQICHLLVNGGEQGDSTMYATAPWLECLCAAPILHEREANDYTMEQLAAMTADRPRFFKSHANFPDLPRGSKTGIGGAGGVKAIIVSRNPKDTCVSMWHHAREKPEFNLAGGAPRPGSDDPPAPTPVCDDFEEFVQLFLAGKAECGEWRAFFFSPFPPTASAFSPLFIDFLRWWRMQGAGSTTHWSGMRLHSRTLISCSSGTKT